MEDHTFTLLPIRMDPSSKALTSTASNLAEPLKVVNQLHRTILALPSEAKQTPPAPLPTNPKRSAQIQKMREQGNAALQRSQPQAVTTGTEGGSNAGVKSEAIKFYTYAIDMALQRPSWEPAGLVREEASILYANRAQAYMSVGMWPEGSIDAETSVVLKRVGNGKAWWRKGKCLVEMSRWSEARKWVADGLEVESGAGVEENGGAAGGGERELKALMTEIESRLVAK